MWKLDGRYIVGLFILLASILLFIPFFFPAPKIHTSCFSWAPGYWSILPEVGIARIVPFSRNRLVNPAAGGGPGPIREPADNSLPPKY